MRYTNKYPSPLGKILLASDGDSLTGLWFEGQKYFAAGLEGQSEEMDLPVFLKTRAWLDTYFSGRDPGPVPELSLTGTAFRVNVLRLLLSIPYGHVATYADIARKVQGRTSSARAVANAISHNPISIIIPCHRVIGANGRLTGYAGGLERKTRLLEMEGLRVQGERVLPNGD